MKNWLLRKFGLRCLIFMAATGLLFGGIASAAIVAKTYHGSVTIVGAGGGGTPPPGVPLQPFKVYNGNTPFEITDVFFEYGLVTANYTVDRTVEIEMTTANTTMTVTPSVSFLDALTGTFTFSPTSVDATYGVRRPINIRFTAGPGPHALNNFSVFFTGTPIP
jgi:hypothetical protein